jgi:protein TonB
MLTALLFHCLLAGAIIGYAYLNGLFSHNTWGGANEGGAIAVQLVSNALPLPADQKPNEHVLATEHPSEAPAPPAPKAQPTVDEKAIAIPDKVVTPKKPADKKQEASKVTKPVPTPVTPSKLQQRQQPTKPDQRAQYGEQASTHMARATQPVVGSNGPVTVNAGIRGFNYPFYVTNIQRKMIQNLNRSDVDTRTPKGAQAFIVYTIRRDGTATDVRLDKSSGSPTLDRACVRAAQRVDTFGPLPSPVTDGPLNVSYYCEY